MKDGHKYNLEYPKTVVLVRSGVFCQTFDDAALVVSALTDYQVIQQKNNHARCGFKVGLIPKIKLILSRNHVSYVELQTNSSNEQVEILDDYDNGDDCSFVALRDKGRELVRARQQAADKISAIRQDSNSLYSEQVIPCKDKDSSIKSEEWKFVDALCRGFHPFTGEKIRSLNLNNPDIIRALYSVREIVTISDNLANNTK